MKENKKISALLAGAVLCSGCMTHGAQFDPNLADRLQPGVSTVQDAAQLLGRPSAESRLANGEALMQWQYVTGTMVGGRGSHLAVLFDSNGRMIRIVHKWSQ